MNSSSAHRLISLLPGTTEWVCALGLQSSLVGISHECDFPPAVTQLPRVSGTLIQHESPSLAIDAQVRAALAAGESLYQLDLAQIQRLAPTLLISQSLCAVCGVDSDTVAAALCDLPGGIAQFNFAPMSLTSLFQAVGNWVRNLGSRIAPARSAWRWRRASIRSGSAPPRSANCARRWHSSSGSIRSSVAGTGIRNW